MREEPIANENPKTLAALLEISREVFSTLNFQEVLYRIVKHVADVIQVVRCSIVVVDEKEQTGRILATFEDPDAGEIRIDLKKYPEISAAVREEKVVLVRDVARDPIIEEYRDLLLSLGVRSILVLPLFDPEKEGDTIRGTLYLRTSRARETFSEEEVHFCRIVANMASVALKNASLFHRVEEERRQLERLAVTDDLTQLYNHRYFFQRLKEEFKRAARYRAPMSCIMLDIDDFKRVNDLYGHPRGDIVLQEVAKLIRGSVRETDIAARYGGEEFTLILPHTDSESAFNLAQRIREEIKQFHFPGLDGNHTVTASFGIATSKDPSIRKAEDLVGIADRALYAAKVKGKDRVER